MHRHAADVAIVQLPVFLWRYKGHVPREGKLAFIDGAVIAGKIIEVKTIGVLILCFIQLVVRGQQGGIPKSAIGVSFNFLHFSHVKNSFNNPKIWTSLPSMGMLYNYSLNGRNRLILNCLGSFKEFEKLEILDRNKLNIDFFAGVSSFFFHDKELAQPYITGGFGMNYFNQHFLPSLPAGAGIEFRISKDIIGQINIMHWFSLNHRSESKTSFGLNFLGVLPVKSQKKKMEIKTILFNYVKDTDGDGIPDLEDECPDLPGFIKYNGCPFSNAKNLNYNIVLSSVIEINTSKIKFPALKNTVIQFKMDKQRSVQLINDEISILSKNIHFETASSALNVGSYFILDQISSILKLSSELIIISGHTDNEGTESYNMELSFKRANTVKNYLIEKGIYPERISTNGFGANLPIESNESSEGREKNRRVEIKLQKSADAE